MPRKMVRCFDGTLQFFANAIKQRIECREKCLRRKSTPAWVPHPLVSQRADAAHRFRWVGHSGERGRHHVAVLERAGELRALVWVMPQPMQQLGETPLVGVHAAAPFDGLDVLLMRELCDLLRFRFGAMVAPQVILVERPHARVDRNHAGAGRIERNGLNGCTRYTGCGNRLAARFYQRPHLVVMRLGCVVGIFAFAMQRVLGDRSRQPSSLAVDDRHTRAECAEVYSRNDCHVNPLPVRGSRCSSRDNCWSLRKRRWRSVKNWRRRGARSLLRR